MGAAPGPAGWGGMGMGIPMGAWGGTGPAVWLKRFAGGADGAGCAAKGLAGAEPLNPKGEACCAGIGIGTGAPKAGLAEGGGVLNSGTAGSGAA